MTSDKIRDARTDQSESGAILILALVFLIVVSASVAVLTTWVTNNLNNTTEFTNARSMDYSATSAMETAINSIRYSPLVGANQTLNASPPSYCWGSSDPSALTTDSIDIAVWCSTNEDLQSSSTRTVTFSACKSAVSAASCAATPLLQAIVVFDDYPPGGSTVLTQQCSTYCGEGAQLDSWDWGSVAISPAGTTANSIDVTSTPPILAPLNSMYTPSDSATSGDTVVVTATPTTVCGASGGVVTFIGAGTCLVDFNDPGNVNYSAAAQVQQSVSVGLLVNSITVTSTPTNPTAGPLTYTPVASATSGDLVAVTSASTPVCTVSSGVVTFLGAGSCTLDFNDPGNSSYGIAPQVQQVFTVAAAATAGVDIQGVPDPQDGTPDNGDAVLFSFNQPMQPSSIQSGWQGTTGVGVWVQLTGSKHGSTAMEVCANSSCSTVDNLGSVNLGDPYPNVYLSSSTSTIFSAEMTLSTVNGDSVVTVTLSTLINRQTTPSVLVPKTTSTTLTWTPSASAQSTGGVACSTSIVTETGSPKLNF